jgi:hypothetical protein
MRLVVTHMCGRFTDEILYIRPMINLALEPSLDFSPHCSVNARHRHYIVVFSRPKILLLAMEFKRGIKVT